MDYGKKLKYSKKKENSGLKRGAGTNQSSKYKHTNN